MDLIFTNSDRVDQGVLGTHTLDLSYGVAENDFEMTLNAAQKTLDFGAFLYIEGTEYGGIVDGMGSNSSVETVTYKGRTWHGVLNSKVIQPVWKGNESETYWRNLINDYISSNDYDGLVDALGAGTDWFSVSGEANRVLGSLIARLGLSELFVADANSSGVNISNYQFKTYCKAYDGIREMLSSAGAKLKMKWKDRSIVLSAEPVVDYTNAPVDEDIATLAVERYEKKVNHLICLGKGELAERETVHLYVDQFGRIGDKQYYTGINEITEIYDNNGAESSEELKNGGIEHLTELRNIDTAEISVNETDERIFDIGDIVGATDNKSGITTAEAVSQKIVKIQNGAITIEYKTGG